MTFTTRTFKAAAILSAVMTVSLATPAVAASQNDVKQCRTAMTTQSNINMTDYRLRFVSETGHRTRVMTLKAIPFKAARKNGTSAFDFTCTLSRNSVIAVNRIGSTQFAKSNTYEIKSKS